MSKALQIGPPSQDTLRNKFTLGHKTLKVTDTSPHLGITLNTKDDLTDHLMITKCKTPTTTQKTLDFKKKADIICKVINRIKQGLNTNHSHTNERTQITDSGTDYVSRVNGQF